MLMPSLAEIPYNFSHFVAVAAQPIPICLRPAMRVGRCEPAMRACRPGASRMTTLVWRLLKHSGGSAWPTGLVKGWAVLPTGTDVWLELRSLSCKML